MRFALPAVARRTVSGTPEYGALPRPRNPDLARLRLLATVTLVTFAACAARDPASLAARLDRDGKTGVHAWLASHDPSSLDVSAAPIAALRPLVPDGTLRTVSKDLHVACAAARRDRALLLVFADPHEGQRRDAALDCGVAVYRDNAALVIAPR